MSKAFLIQASARRIPLADGVIQTAVFSPPYWGLRSYGTHPQVWGGLEGCDHAWGPWCERRDVREEAESGKSRTTDRFYGDPSRKFDGNHQKHTAGAFCQKCGAWRGELGNEPTPELFVEHTVEYMREVRRVLRHDGTVWFNIGDSYATGAGSGRAMGGKVFGKQNEVIDAGSYPVCQPNRMPQKGLKPKDLCMIPHRVALALQADGWWVRDTIIWHKPNPMPSSVTDRTTTAHEYIFLLTKSATYFYDADAIREPVTSTGGASFGKQKHSADGTGAASRRLASPEERNNPLGRNKRSVWTIPTQSYHGAHFATFPTRLVEPCIKAGTSEKGCCPRCGAPWKRIAERVREPDPTAGHNAMRGAGHFRDGSGPANRDGRVFERIASAVTVAWVPSCKCHAGSPVPCKVLDCFNGSGTTVATAVRLGRTGIGTDLNADYMPLARERIEHARHAKPKKAKRPRAPKGEPMLWEVAS